MTWVSCCLLICLFVCLHIPWQRDEMMVWFVNVPPTPQRPAWVNVFAAAVLIFSPLSHISFLFLCLSHSLTFSFPLLRLMREVWEIKRGPGPLMQPCWGPKCVCGGRGGGGREKGKMALWLDRESALLQALPRELHMQPGQKSICEQCVGYTKHCNALPCVSRGPSKALVEELSN